MTYLGELRINWRYIAAACLGLASGHGLTFYVSGLFADHLIRDFGWTRSQFALTGITMTASIIALPVAGRLTDRFGVMRVAPVGVALTPLIFLAYAMMNGSFALFLAINIFQILTVGALTTSTVYSRLIAERFVLARGIALSLVACAPAATAAAIIPFLSIVITDHGWRAGYMVLAVGTAITGTAALLLVPRRPDIDRQPAITKAEKKHPYGEIFANRAFQIIAVGVILNNITHAVLGPQLKLVLIEQGLSAAQAGGMLSLFALGIVLGRLSCGIALDRLPSHIVSAVVLGLPGIGLLILISGVHDTLIISGTVLITGMATGAEFDVLGYLAMRFFRVEIYSTVYSTMALMVALSGATGAGLLSLTLKLSDSYAPFLTGAAISTLAGASMYLLLGRQPPVRGEH